MSTLTHNVKMAPEMSTVIGSLGGYLHVLEKYKDDIFSRDPFLEQFHRVLFYSETYNLDSNDTQHKCMLKIVIRNDRSMDRSLLMVYHSTDRLKV